MVVFALTYLLTLSGIVGAAYAHKGQTLSGPWFSSTILVMLVSGVVLALGQL